MNRAGRRKAKGIYHKEDTTDAKEGQSEMMLFGVEMLNNENGLIKENGPIAAGEAMAEFALVKT